MNVIDRFDLFAARCDELANTRLIRSEGLQASLSFRYDHRLGFSMQTANVDEDDLRSFLLTLRQFVSAKEPVFLFRGYNLLIQRLTSDFLRQEVHDAREHWKRSQKQRGLDLVVDGDPYRPEIVADLWINGVYFHNDEEHRLRLRRLVPEAFFMVRWMFLDYLIETTRHIFYVRRILRMAGRDGLLDLRNPEA